MENARLILLCCATLITACDKPVDTDKTDSTERGVADVVSSSEELKANVTEKTDATTDTLSDRTSDMLATVDGNDGESIYKNKCFACHGTGVAGAPRLGDKAAWEARIAKGNDLLIQHAIEGYKGETGYMPPKGGYATLDNDEISQAVNYMVSQSK